MADTEVAVAHPPPKQDSEIENLYGAYVKPQLKKVLKLLKLNKTFIRASGESLFYEEDGKEREIIDFLGGYGSTILGHNQPDLVAALIGSLESQFPVHAQASVRSWSALAAKKINEMIRHETGSNSHYYVTFTNSGAEAVEAAIKHAFMEWSQAQKRLLAQLQGEKQRSSMPDRVEELIQKIKSLAPILIALEGSFHGKTAGALSVTSNSNYSEMYAQRPLTTFFAQKNSSKKETEDLFKGFDINVGGSKLFSPVIAVIIEPTQCEGGIFELSEGFLKDLYDLCLERRIPLIADEIQTGLYRTGTFLAMSEKGILPDYITLGKSLGGGLVKIAATLISKARYQPDFGVIHTSTFAEDDLSSHVAYRTLQSLDTLKLELQRRSHLFFERVKQGIDSIANKYPGIIQECRGQGFLLGIQFNFTDESSFPLFLKWVYESGYATYVFASYLLHRHSIRTGVTLSQPDTLRIEPCAFISEAACMRLLTALEDLVKTLHERKILKLTQHLYKNLPSDIDVEVVSHSHKSPKLGGSGLRKVGFLTHLINTDTLKNIDNLFKALPRTERQRFHQKFGTLDEGYLYHEQIIEGANGEKVHLHLYGLLAASDYFLESLRAGDLKALFKIQGVLRKAESDGMLHTGLGQYTSIVSDNGYLLADTTTQLTTGNSLTAGLAYRGLVRLCTESGLKLSDLNIGVVGITGNICNVLTQLLADEARHLTLIGRRNLQDGTKLQNAVERILANSQINKEQISVSCDLGDLASCDLVLTGTNSAEAIIMAEHLKAGALALDISVPSNIHSSVKKERPDVRCFQGGFAKLPFGQVLNTPLVPCPSGEVFACLAETLTVSLTNEPGHFSFGPLTKEKVMRALNLADQAGFTLGSLKSEALF